jgi:DNA-directed RNA polymerase specialized sigma subunit
MTDKEQLLQWQKTGDPKTYAEMVIRYQPIVHKIVSQYRTTGVSPATLRAEAATQLIKSFKSYNPNLGTQPSTHVWNSLKKVQRTASESLMSGHIPENRALKKSTFTITRDNLTDRLGYEPSTSQMADELGWNQKEVGRMTHELGGETTASRAAFDFYGNAVTEKHKDIALAEYLYHELSGPEQVIFEHTFGFGGKQILNNKQLAKKLRKNEMWISRAKKKLGKRIRDYR